MLSHLNSLVDDNVPFRLTMSLTPTLCSMLTDELLQERYARHCGKLVELAEKEVERTARHPDFSRTSRMYFDKFRSCLRQFEDLYNRNLVAAFRTLQDKGVLEIITGGATHAFFPTMQNNENAVRAQVSIAADSYRRFFGRDPQGIWLPECGYYPGLEAILDKEGLKYFFRRHARHSFCRRAAEVRRFRAPDLP